jgi:hypothetical protein
MTALLPPVIVGAAAATGAAEATGAVTVARATIFGVAGGVFTIAGAVLLVGWKRHNQNT